MKKINLFLIGSQVLLIVFLVMSIRGCNNRQLQLENNELKLQTYLEESQKFEVLVNEKNEVIASQELVLLSKDREIEKQLLENTSLKKLNTQIKIDFDNRVEDIIADYVGDNNTIYITKRDTIRDSIPIGIKFGTPFNKKDDWYSISGKIERNGVLFDSLSFNNHLTITVGQKKEGVFKPYKTYVEVNSENPYTTFNSLNNVSINDESKIWSKPWFNFLLGAAAGTVVTTIATK